MAAQRSGKPSVTVHREEVKRSNSPKQKQRSKKLPSANGIHNVTVTERSNDHTPKLSQPTITNNEITSKAKKIKENVSEKTLPIKKVSGKKLKGNLPSQMIQHKSSNGDNPRLHNKSFAKSVQRISPKKKQKKQTESNTRSLMKLKKTKVPTLQNKKPEINLDENWKKLLEKQEQDQKSTHHDESVSTKVGSSCETNSKNSTAGLKRKKTGSSIPETTRKKRRTNDKESHFKHGQKHAFNKSIKSEPIDNKEISEDSKMSLLMEADKNYVATNEDIVKFVERDKAILNSMFAVEKQLGSASNSSREMWFDDVDALLVEEAADNSMTEAYRPIAVRDPSARRITQCLAVDCEMVEVTKGKRREMALARVSLVNRFGQCIYDSYVSQIENVINYHTRYSGVTEANLRQFGRDFETVRNEVIHLTRDRILIGHAIHNDLKALKLSHSPRSIRDTQLYSLFVKVCGTNRPSLKHLAAEFLNLEVQTGPHSSIEDAQTCMRLYTLVRKDWENQLTAAPSTDDVTQPIPIPKKINRPKIQMKGKVQKKTNPQFKVKTQSNAIPLPLD